MSNLATPRQEAIARLQDAYASNGIPPVNPRDIGTLKVCEIVALAKHWEQARADRDERLEAFEDAAHSCNCGCHKPIEYGHTHVDGRFRDDVTGLAALILRDDGGNWA